jgi:hypothetical protein
MLPGTEKPFDDAKFCSCNLAHLVSSKHPTCRERSHILKQHPTTEDNEDAREDWGCAE